jgi:magnesium-transporting ATPase (P-type)
MAAFYFMYWTNGYGGQWIELPGEGPLYAAATAMALAAVVMTQVGNVFAQRTEIASTFRLPLFHNRLIWIGIAVEIILILAIVYTPFGNQVVGTAPFPAANWLFLIAWIPSLVLVDEIRKALLRRRRAWRARKEARR